MSYVFHFVRRRKFFTKKTMKLMCTGKILTFHVSTPVKQLVLEVCCEGIHKLCVDRDSKDSTSHGNRTVEILESVEDLSFAHPALHALRWLQAYFHSPTEKHIEMPNICFLGTGTDNKASYTKEVLAYLANNVSFGQKLSYGELAKLTSNPKASRAVGQIMAVNNVIIMVPCHRVILSSGKLGNYSRGEYNDMKQWLLDHEQSASKRSIKISN